MNPSFSLKRKNETESFPSIKSSKNDESDSPSNLSKNKVQGTIGAVFQGFHSNCKALNEAYWNEFLPIRVGTLELHLYPKPSWEKQWKLVSEKQNYHDFVVNKLMAQKIDLSEINVLYFSKLDLNQFRVSILDGKLYKKQKLLSNKNYIFVLNLQNEFFVGTKTSTSFGKIQHSSFTKGTPVNSAGWMKFDDTGRIIEIANFSGHYRPVAQQVFNIVNFLQKNQVDLSHLSIVYSPTGIAENFQKYPLIEWLKLFEGEIEQNA